MVNLGSLVEDGRAGRLEQPESPRQDLGNWKQNHIDYVLWSSWTIICHYFKSLGFYNLFVSETELYLGCLAVWYSWGKGFMQSPAQPLHIQWSVWMLSSEMVPTISLKRPTLCPSVHLGCFGTPQDPVDFQLNWLPNSAPESLALIQEVVSWDSVSLITRSTH